MNKVVKKLLTPLFIIINNGVNNLNLNHKYLIYFDGGLGSQIISYMQIIVFENEQIQYYVNKDFFDRSKTDSIFKIENTYRKWQLEYFGIKLVDLKNTIKYNRLFQHNNHKKTLQLAKFFDLKQKSNYNFSNFFPVTQQTIINISNLGINIKKDYTAIHIRRGDFLKFSSLIIDDQKFIKFLSNVKNFLNKNIILISDSSLSDYLKNNIFLLFPDSEIKILIGGDEIEIHTIMRFSKILVTSNSMYSLSAAMLQKEGSISIVPKYFFGPNETYYNVVFSKIYDWSILTN